MTDLPDKIKKKKKNSIKKTKEGVSYKTLFQQRVRKNLIKKMAREDALVIYENPENCPFWISCSFRAKCKECITIIEYKRMTT